ncbi:sigma-54-dependent Fis family transcriptional regulator [Methylotenera mobilis]|jgi:transcriptional regulator of acetoin/glycerol metabolism|uniref:sigma-54-dependent Fis family transcriptional regulator n=1 Tax=Methylotenera mobilis TaxID=359408 RepID=UPI000379A2DC|nr:sigma-54-dependent Fis family transcriptional regulator [Methylotenera mobilis]PPC97060.1 MAG: sigma-54-dependent Fis family transcriptional regulator [Methylotenera sp.]
MSNATTDKTPTILQARKEFLSNGNVEQGAIAEAIERSWRRCLANGIDTNSPPSLEVVTAQELALKREQNQQLLKLAQPEMETLNEQIAHTRNVVILTDDEGVILHSLGGHHFMNEDQRVALSAGASWHEDHRGTNAIGTVLIEQSALTVQGAEHFMAYHHSLSCSAVPIFGAENQLIATLDVSNDSNTSQQHTLALIKMSAQMIENRLFLASHQGDVVLHFHARPEFIGTLWEGVAIFTAGGQLVAINRSGQFQLSLNTGASNANNARAYPPINFDQLFDIPFTSLLRQTGSADKLIVPLRLNNGARIYVQVELLHKKQRISTSPPAIVKRTSAANLDLLDSGDAKISRAIQQIKQVLSRDIPILIQGETGVGKELFARAIHEASAQHKGPWIAVNCAALPEGLIEAELFGYEEGAFTGARRKGSPGKIEQANGGTLFLDEIGDMPLSLQARLLRVLQERTVTPLGSTRTIPVNFSLISATNLKLKEKVECGAFRSDLYYRLNGLSVALPPLRDRSDLLALIDVILHIEQAGNIEITPEVMEIFKAHSWPGNIRQLHNVLRTALALADGLPISTLHLTQDFIDEISTPLLANINDSPSKSLDLGDVTSHTIQLAMQAESGNISAVARKLGISRNTLYRKLKTMGLS